MAQAARREASAEPPVDPTAVERAYRLERAKRRARFEAAQARRHARLRFVVVIALLVAVCAVFTMAAWQQVSRLFGL
jgi:hypothetical protein